ncbi:glycosyltransferase [Lichenicola sp.]|uniref:glycosyltransferase n=1 Tax=Lichenicola sp. TaxID=2804529 RepID=UPI003B0002AF
MAFVGYLDHFSRERIDGWAWDPEHPDQASVLRVIVDGQVITTVIANGFRPDLVDAGIGDGRHAFTLDAAVLCLPITSVLVRVQDDATHQELLTSPRRLDAPLELNADMKRTMVALFESPGSDDAVRDRVQFLAEQTGHLLQRLADRQSGRRARAAARSRAWRWRPEDGAKPPGPTPRALVIDSILPATARDAGSNAILSHVSSLQRLGFEVTFVPADMQPGEGLEALLATGVIVMCEPWAASVEEVFRRQAGEFDLVYLHRLEVAHCYIPFARHHMPKARLIFSVADLQHLRLLRQAAIEDRPELLRYAHHIRQQEFAAALACNAVITHSVVEAALLRRAVPSANIVVVPWVVRPQPTEADFASRSGVAFVGGYKHAPNADAAIWLTREIMPLVWRQAPQIKCLLVGSALPPVLKSPGDPRIIPVGHVDSLDRMFNEVRLSVAPLAYGAGLKGKVVDSLAAGVPCVCTPIAAEGFNLPAPLSAFVSDAPEGLADAIVRLHADEAAFLECRAAGLDYVRQTFSEDAVDGRLRLAAGVPVIG